MYISAFKKKNQVVKTITIIEFNKAESWGSLTFKRKNYNDSDQINSKKLPDIQFLELVIQIFSKTTKLRYKVLGNCIPNQIP